MRTECKVMMAVAALTLGTVVAVALLDGDHSGRGGNDTGWAWLIAMSAAASAAANGDRRGGCCLLRRSRG